MPKETPNGPPGGLRALVEAVRGPIARPPVLYTRERFIRDVIGRVMELGIPLDRAFDHETDRHIEIGKDHHA
jgi:hypothetical protein